MLQWHIAEWISKSNQFIVEFAYALKLMTGRYRALTRDFSFIPEVPWPPHLTQWVFEDMRAHWRPHIFPRGPEQTSQMPSAYFFPIKNSV
jgi:hypothetical protein